VTPVARAEATIGPLHPASRAGVQGTGPPQSLAPAVAWLVVAVVAYRFSLGTFAGTLRLDTPLAYLPLLPVLAVTTAAMTLRRRPAVDATREDRAVDLLLGIPLLLVALLLVTVIPVVWSTYYWTDRPDVLSLGLFVIGGLVVLYGARWCWRLRGAMVFLILMWPGLYGRPLPGLLQSLTSATNEALAFLLAHLPIAAVTSPDNSLVTLNPASADPIQVSVGSVCAGGNSLLGFLLLGGGLLLSLTGGRARKLAWLLAGLGLMFAANLVRLVSILALASGGHSSLALGGFHDTIGVVLFAATVVATLLLMPRFGLSFGRRPVSTGAPAGGEPPTPVARSARRRVRGRATTVPAATLAVVAVLAGIANGGLRQYAGWADGTGSPTVLPFATNGAVPAGWYLQHLANYGWGEQYFGPGSSFDRLALIIDGGTVTVDVVRTSDPGTLAAYNLQNCFLFHNYDIRTAERVDLGLGVTGLVLDYHNPSSGKSWATVSWAWPVRHQGGTAYERIVLTSEPIHGSDEASPDAPSSAERAGNGRAGNGQAGTLRAPLIALMNLLCRADRAEAGEVYGAANSRLVGVANDLVDFTVGNGSAPPMPVIPSSSPAADPGPPQPPRVLLGR